MKQLTALISLICIVHTGFGQAPYNKAIGLKFPGGIAVTYKKFITESNALEAEAIEGNKGFRLAGLYEFNFYNLGVNGLAWFAGPGVHIGFYSASGNKQLHSTADFGADGIIGLDYKFNEAPVNISIDWQPSVTLAGRNDFPSSGGIAVRYTF